MATWRPLSVGAVRCVTLRLLLGVILVGSLAATTLASKGSVHGAEVTGAFSRILEQSLDCSTADSSNSSADTGGFAYISPAQVGPSAGNTDWPAGAAFSMAYDGSALDTVAKVKQAIMLDGGVRTALASLPAFEFLNCTTLHDADASASEEPDWHAAFCYGWRDAANNTGEGWWLCKNSWVASWGCDGTFRMAYGAAYGMPPDYTYAIQFGPKTEAAKQAKARQLL
ncbi:hypothetical protein OEZ85_002462 [Tetradesmus obliquus]|uniref:Peptidase C1A papain C-terminal domain-containing protein n=1 Tax=Tetradesmus obliquus TaxID=3088 RepID=A0ABY8TXL1_TETOB|nr:hypothetical protein OEZ85_002462 [Tetradesmus obliquus]